MPINVYILQQLKFLYLEPILFVSVTHQIMLSQVMRLYTLYQFLCTSGHDMGSVEK